MGFAFDKVTNFYPSAIGCCREKFTKTMSNPSFVAPLHLLIF